MSHPLVPESRLAFIQSLLHGLVWSLIWPVKPHLNTLSSYKTISLSNIFFTILQPLSYVQLLVLDHPLTWWLQCTSLSVQLEYGYLQAGGHFHLTLHPPQTLATFNLYLVFKANGHHFKMITHWIGIWHFNSKEPHYWYSKYLFGPLSWKKFITSNMSLIY